MKRLALGLIFAALTFVSLPAQDTAADNHHGPVVYPANAAPDTNANTTPAAATTSVPETMAPDTNSDIAPDAAANNNSSSADAGGVSVTPQIVTPSGNAPGSSIAPLNPATNPLQNIANAGNGLPGSGSQQKDDIYDIRQPYFYIKSWFWIWMILLAIAFAAAWVVAIWYLLPKIRAHRAKTAYELTLEKLEKARSMLNEQNPEPYAVFVSETIRSYLGQRFRARATHRTTEEFLKQMQTDSNTPLAAHRELLGDFLQACDLVKFAHYEPGREELEKVQQRAVTFVTATRPAEGAPA